MKNNMNNTTSTNNTNNSILNNAISISREEVKNLNQRQTVLIESNFTDGKVSSKRIFLGNYNKRAHAYYDCFIAGQFLHRRGKNEYRLLKLFRALEELEGFEAVEFIKLESYLPDPKPVVKPQEEAAEATATEVTEGLSNDETAGAEEFGEVIVNEAVATIVEEPKKGKAKKGGNKKK